jgi:hypothetical protein
MLDTVGPELQVVNKSETPISLEENGTVVLTPHQGQEASSSLLPINFSGLAKVNMRSCCFFLLDLVSYVAIISVLSCKSFPGYPVQNLFSLFHCEPHGGQIKTNSLILVGCETRCDNICRAILVHRK